MYSFFSSNKTPFFSILILSYCLTTILQTFPQKTPISLQQSKSAYTKKWYQTSKIWIGIGAAALSTMIFVAAYNIKKSYGQQQKLRQQADVDERLLWSIKGELDHSFSLDNLSTIAKREAQRDPLFFNEHNIGKLIEKRSNAINAIAERLMQKIQDARTEQDFNEITRDSTIQKYMDANPDVQALYDSMKQLQISKQKIAPLLTEKKN